jgi:hypothetical protein
VTCGEGVKGKFNYLNYNNYSYCIASCISRDVHYVHHSYTAMHTEVCVTHCVRTAIQLAILELL